MNNIIFIRHGNLFVVIDTIINEILDVFNNLIDMLMEYPTAKENFTV